MCIDLLFLAGKSGSGKDTVADHLCSGHGFQRLAFADPLKRAAKELFGLTDDQLWGERRNTPVVGEKSPRELVQALGDWAREKDSDVLLCRCRQTVEDARREGRRVVVTDLRMPRELALARNMGGRVWRIDRRLSGAPLSCATHPTETSMSQLAESEFDHLVRNDGSMVELYALIDRLLAG